jgi:hypothetical protein
MKKLLAMSMILMIAITSISCSNDQSGASSDYTNQTFTSKNIAQKGEPSESASQSAIDAVKNGTLGRLPGGGTVIHCHTNYLNDVGHACVSSGGYMFNVSWTSQYTYPSGESGYYPDGPVYTSTQVSYCNC